MLAGFGLGVVMLVGIAFIAWRSTQVFVRSADLVAHTRQVLGTEERVLRHLMEMESERLAFLLTGDEKRVRGFDHALWSMNEHFNLLLDLVSDDGEARGRVAKLRALLDDSILKQRAEIELRRTGGIEAARTVFTRAESDQLGREIGAVITDFEDYELTRLGQSFLKPMHELLHWAQRNHGRVREARKAYVPPPRHEAL